MIDLTTPSMHPQSCPIDSSSQWTIDIDNQGSDLIRSSKALDERSRAYGREEVMFNLFSTNPSPFRNITYKLLNSLTFIREFQDTE